MVIQLSYRPVFTLHWYWLIGLKRYTHTIWDKKFMFDIRVHYWWHWYQYLKSEKLWPKNQLIKRKSILLLLCVHRCLQTTIDYRGIAILVSSQNQICRSRMYSKSRTLFILFIQQQCQRRTARKIERSSISLLTEYFIYLFIDPT